MNYPSLVASCIEYLRGLNILEGMNMPDIVIQREARRMTEAMFEARRAFMDNEFDKEYH